IPDSDWTRRTPSRRSAETSRPSGSTCTCSTRREARGRRPSRLPPPPSALEVPLEPGVHLAVPDERVPGLQDPVVLVREENQPRADTFGFVEVVDRERLIVGDAKVALPVHHEHRRREPTREPRRIPAVDRLEPVPGLAAVGLMAALRDVAPVFREEIEHAGVV